MVETQVAEVGTSAISDGVVQELYDRLEAAKQYIPPGNADIFVLEHYINILNKYRRNDGGYGHSYSVAEATEKAEKTLAIIEKFLEKLEARAQ